MRCAGSPSPPPTTPASEPPVKLVSTALKQKIAKLDIVRTVLFVPPSMPVGDLLQSMQSTRVHMAIVVDEYGGTDGLVTIEDLLEAVVGEIEDEHDDLDTSLVRKVDANTCIANARAELDEVRAWSAPISIPASTPKTSRPSAASSSISSAACR